MSLERDHANKLKSISTVPLESRDNPGCFDCNICLDLVCDPVVTLCGHLYCWPCIYKWFHTQSSSDEQPTCPVCKNGLSYTALVPLYGRGHSPKDPNFKNKAPSPAMGLPRRPKAFGTQPLPSTSQNGQHLLYRNPYQNQNFEVNYPSSLSHHHNGSTAIGLFHPLMGMFGEMFYTRIFGNSGNIYRYSNSYYIMGRYNPGLRRQQMQAARSLNRITIFLFCCCLLCLLLF